MQATGRVLVVFGQAAGVDPAKVLLARIMLTKFLLAKIALAKNVLPRVGAGLAASALAWLIASSAVARAQEAAPQLMLDTGGHMAIIRSLIFTPDGQQLISAADDKVIRVWDLQAGKTVRTIRGQVGPGFEGTTYAMALSPDSRWLAVGGWMHRECEGRCGEIRLYDFATGQLTALLKGHINTVFSLAFSPDGKHLVSGSFDRTAIIWDVNDHRLLYRLAGHTGLLQGVAFTPDGERVITASEDTTLKLWSVSDGRELATLAGHSDKVRSMAVSSLDGLIASGSRNGEIRLWDSRTGRFVRTLANQGVEVGALSFSADGKLLVAGNGAQIGPFPLRVWDVATGRIITTYTGHTNTVFAATVAPDGLHVATGGSAGDIQLWDLKTGETQQVLAGIGAPTVAVGFSGDGQQIGWGTKWKMGWTSNDRGDLDWEMHLPGQRTGLGRPEPLGGENAKGFVRARASYGPYQLIHRKGGPYGYDEAILDIVKNGQTQKSIERGAAEGYDHRAYSFAPDGMTFVSGGANGVMTAYDGQGNRRGNYVGHEGLVWALAPSPDGRLLLSGGGDQTIRLWNLATRELIASLFRGSDGEWVMWIPQGYYASSPNGDRIVGWQIDRGYDQAAEYVAASQLRNQFYRPAIVERAIILGSAVKAVQEVGVARIGGFQLADLKSHLPPKIVVPTAYDHETSRGLAAITLAVAEAQDDPIKSFDLFVNDTRVTATAKRVGGNVSFDVPLAKGGNRIRVVAHSKSDLVGEAKLEITQNGEGALDKRDNLFIIAIGVDKYPNLPKSCGPNHDVTCDLSFAGADAKAFAETIENEMGRQHEQVIKRVLFNGAAPDLEPTAGNIIDAMDVLRESRNNDTVAIFIAGHGYSDPHTGYQFLPSNVRPGDHDNFASSTVVNWLVFESAIQSAKGRRLLFVDTCRSGNAFNARLIKDASDEGVVAFSATNTQQDAIELPNLGHGVFTDVLIKGLRGAADVAHEREVRVFDLGAFLEREVRKLTNGRQTPDFYKKPGAENFVLVRM
jgi:WD40 repeat protein